MREQLIGMDIGGSHVAGAIIQPEKGISEILNVAMDTKDRAGVIIETISRVIIELTKGTDGLINVGIAMPGPFNYSKGVCEIHGVGGKFSKCFGLHFTEAIKNQTALQGRASLHFFNDAHCFAIGAYKHLSLPDQNLICITLGTGFGSSFIIDGSIAGRNDNIPASGMFYCEPFKDGIADDYFSTRWFLQEYKKMTGRQIASVKELTDLADTDANVRTIFQQFGINLAQFLAPWIKRSDSTALIVGGNISRSWKLFSESFEHTLSTLSADIRVYLSEDTEQQIMEGAAFLAGNKSESVTPSAFRKTTQPLLPLKKDSPGNGYEIFPSFHLENGVISAGFASMADALINEKILVIDGYGGILWERFRENLNKALIEKGASPLWYDVNACMKDEDEINAMISDSLNGDDPVFGKKYTGALSDFFDDAKLTMLSPDAEAGMCIVYGTGAALSGWKGKLVYLDVPKNEIQYRMRAGAICNLGTQTTYANTQMYKWFYFVDWPVLNEHKKNLLPAIDFLADEQRVEEISWIAGEALRNALDNILHQPFRARPWFEAGVWGGQWMKSKLPGLNPDEVNYAWSFELITPENGIILEQNNTLLEITFDFLLYRNNRDLLGKAADRFGYEFPIRFDFLDTFNGGNLSIQCHPRTEYIRQHFGENFTQDETYYILDCKDDAEVYLGFQEDIDAEKFRAVLKNAQQTGKELTITDFVQSFPAEKHDLFLIPNGTIHASGRNNLVLEISSTPYIFTFKMYDWQRLDLSGKPRPINIEHAFNNLYFERKGKWVEQHLISRPQLIEQENNNERYLLPTHPDHFYQVERYEFSGEISIKTNGQCHIGMLVEGIMIEVIAGSGKQHFHYAETFVIPAAVSEYLVRNTGPAGAKLVVSFVKDE